MNQLPPTTQYSHLEFVIAVLVSNGKFRRTMKQRGAPISVSALYLGNAGLDRLQFRGAGVSSDPQNRIRNLCPIIFLLPWKDPIRIIRRHLG